MTTSGVKILLRESFLHTVTELDAASPDITYKITPIELTFMRNAVVQCEWFLTKKNLLGKVEERTSSEGITTILHILERMNTYIRAYNEETSRMAQLDIISFLHQRKFGYNDHQRLTAFFNRLEKAAIDFLESTESA